ncbi:MAG TPA: formate dehydrogenase accessory sulfurtransferase FdhD, partial [Polyangiaceae bacterium]
MTQAGYASLDTRGPRVAIARVQTLRAEPGVPLAVRPDELSVEEPLEIRVAGDALAITMRTPGHDHELAAGFLLAEGLIRSRAELGGIAHCGRLVGEGAQNTLDVLAAPGVTLDVDALAGTRRGTLTTAACGVCGRKQIDDLVARLAPVAACAPFQTAFIANLAHELRARQPSFERTGGLHAAGIAHPD